MNRRPVLLGIGALAVSPFFLVQAAAPRRIGVLVNGSERSQRVQFEALREGLRALGYGEGGDVAIDVRWNETGLEGLESKAAELVRSRPDVLVAWPVFSARALHKQTRSIPIVIAAGAGAVELGLAASLARPGGNVTGLLTRGELLVGKRFELLKTLAPPISRAALVFSGQQLVHDAYMQAARESAKSLGLSLIEQKVAAREAVAALADPLRAAGCEGIVVAWDALTVNLVPQLVELAASLRVPAVYPTSQFARAGGLASYAAHLTETYVRAAAYVDKILHGADPAELPIEQPTRFEVIVNLKTAKALGITIPPPVLVRADELIE